MTLLTDKVAILPSLRLLLPVPRLRFLLADGVVIGRTVHNGRG